MDFATFHGIAIWGSSMGDKRTIIVTGANSGIGLETAKGLCELGHDVVISVRDDAKGEATITEIKSKVPNAQVMYITMDMSDPESIRNFVEKFCATGKALHVLINNAGLFKPYSSPERFIARNDPAMEISMTVNCMGTFLLTNLLLEKLKEGAAEANPARIVNVSSGLTITYQQGNKPNDFRIDDIMLADHGHYRSGKQAYRNSKLALNLWSRELAERLQGTNVIVNTVCPGFIPSTGLARDIVTTLTGAIMMWILDSFVGRYLTGSQPVSEGQRRLINMAVGEDTKTTGLFYCDDKPQDEAAEVLNEENRKKIWALCVIYSGL